jgi:hypothetical protein
MPTKKSRNATRTAAKVQPTEFTPQPQSDDWTKLPLLKVVGISASGKSTLVAGLRAAGYYARPVSQEHSNLPDLWQQFDKPWVLIYLDNDLENQRRRRPDVTWDERNLAEERARLAHALAHADLQINTAVLPPDKVLAIVLAFLAHKHIRRAAQPLPPVGATGSPQKNQ